MSGKRGCGGALSVYGDQEWEGRKADAILDTLATGVYIAALCRLQDPWGLADVEVSNAGEQPSRATGD